VRVEPEGNAARGWRRDAFLVGVAIVAWAAAATLYRPALRLELAPIWMVLFMSTLPRAVAKIRRARR
jgi:hypothetical protein